MRNKTSHMYPNMGVYTKFYIAYIQVIHKLNTTIKNGT